MKGVVYKGERLMPGSQAFALYEDKEFQKLDQHMKRLDAEAHARGDVLPRKRETTTNTKQS